jgi:starch synthase
MKKRKINILHIAAECYPAAKTGGLGDVVGSLPKYLNQLDADCAVVIPKYRMPWFEKQSFTSTYGGNFQMGAENIYFHVEKVDGDPLGFSLYTIDIPGKFDRYGIYADENGHFFYDEVERFVAFSRSFLEWLRQWVDKPDVVHCHDHHTGLIPFMMQFCYRYRGLESVPSVFTIHNERYQGAFSWGKKYLIPEFDSWKSGQLDWNKTINPLASAVKCSWKVSTVSPSYMEELKNNSFGLEWLFKNEAHKAQGILNGIDNQYWNPATDTLIAHQFKKSVPSFKLNNKKALLKDTGLSSDLPIVSFIGRLAGEKGGDLLPYIIDSSLSHGMNLQFVVLGTGDKMMESQLHAISRKFPSRTMIKIMYNEGLAHQIYAASDFLIMPSRVEPCGLNQMYAMRYGTIPIVHDIGGLKDSVIDITEDNGCGIKTWSLSMHDLLFALGRALNLYADKKACNKLKSDIMKLDYSWIKSANTYLEMYKSLKS